MCMSACMLHCAGDGKVDLQVRLVPALSLDPDGVNSYAAVGKLKESGQKWPTGYTLQLIAVRPKCAGPHSCSDAFVHVKLSKLQ